MGVVEVVAEKAYCTQYQSYVGPTPFDQCRTLTSKKEKHLNSSGSGSETINQKSV